MYLLFKQNEYWHNTPMDYKRSTFVPNSLFDAHLKELSMSELKVLLVIIRQTNGWIDKNTGKRKKRDRITHQQFQDKTGLSVRIIGKAIQALSTKGLIVVTNITNKSLATPEERKGNRLLFYGLLAKQKDTPTNAKSVSLPRQKGAYNKTNSSKLKKTKEKEVKSIGEIIKRSNWEL